MRGTCILIKAGGWINLGASKNTGNFNTQKMYSIISKSNFLFSHNDFSFSAVDVDFSLSCCISVFLE